MVWKGKIKPAAHNDTPVSNVDFLPTILDATGIKLPEDRPVDGRDILSSAQKDLKNRPLFWHFPVYLEGGNHECQDTVFRTRPGSAIRYGKWKLIQYFENNELELYDLEKDISETHNLAASQPSITKKLLRMLENWRALTHAPVPAALNPDYLIK